MYHNCCIDVAENVVTGFKGVPQGGQWKHPPGGVASAADEDCGNIMSCPSPGMSNTHSPGLS